MKFLIAGLGSVGRRHLRNLVSLGEKDIVLYRTGRSTLPESELEAYPVETDLAAALARQPDAVIVANPTALHLSVAIPAAEAGCHLLLEKPPSHSLAGMDELGAALLRGGGSLLVGFQFRFHPVLGQLRAILAQGELGRPLMARAHWGEHLQDWHPWEDYRQTYAARMDLGGGALRTLCHPLDYLRWLFGEATVLWGVMRTSGVLDLGVEDLVEVGLETAMGTLASVHLDYLQRPAEHTLQIIAEEGCLEWDGIGGSGRWTDGSSEGWVRLPAPPGFQRNDLFVSEMRHFLDIVQGRSAPVCTLEDGLRVMQMIEAVQATARSSSAFGNPES